MYAAASAAACGFAIAPGDGRAYASGQRAPVRAIPAECGNTQVVSERILWIVVPIAEGPHTGPRRMAPSGEPMTLLRRRSFRFTLRTLFAVVTICAVASPLVPPIPSRVEAWRNPPKQVGTSIYMILSRGKFFPTEELLTEESSHVPDK